MLLFVISSLFTSTVSIYQKGKQTKNTKCACWDNDTESHKTAIASARIYIIYPLQQKWNS
jgi:hypothetical protein